MRRVLVASPVSDLRDLGISVSRARVVASESGILFPAFGHLCRPAFSFVMVFPLHCLRAFAVGATIDRQPAVAFDPIRRAAGVRG